MNITDAFVENIIAITDQKLSEGIVHQVKRCVLDYLGVTYAGAQLVEEKLEKYLLSTSSSGECTVIGFDKKTDFLTAGFVNGFSSHYLELDDGHRYGMLHLGSIIISAMFAISQHKKISARQFMKGITVGYETAARLAMASQPDHKLRGFHATGTCGTIGAACAVGTALNFNEQQLKNTVSAAATSAAGLLEVIDDASELKPYNVAKAVMNGLTSACIGMAGFAGPDDVLGGARGFFSVLTENYHPELLFNNINKAYAIEKIYVKPYAACRHCHSAIECALNISKKAGFDYRNIRSIEVETYRLAVFGHDHTDIVSVNSAKMSIAFSVAAACVLRKAGIDAFTDQTIECQDILKLCHKVRVTENKELTALSPEKRGAIVEITMEDGTIFTDRIDYPLGEPENNMSDSDLEDKFDSLMENSGKKAIDILKIKHMTWNLETEFDELIKII